MTTTTSTAEASTAIDRVGPPRIVPLLADQPAMRDWTAQLVERARSEGESITARSGLPGKTKYPVL